MGIFINHTAEEENVYLLRYHLANNVMGMNNIKLIFVVMFPLSLLGG